MVGEIKGMLRSGNLQKGFQASPLRHVKGIFEGFEVTYRNPGGQQRAYVQIQLADVDVIEATEPYDFPIAVIEIPYSDRQQSFWGIFQNSIKEVTGEDPLPEFFTDTFETYLKGQQVEMKMVGDHMMWDGREGKETPREAWELIGLGEAGAPVPGGVSGATGKVKAAKKSGEDRALELLDGHSEQEWNQIVFKDPIVRGDATLISNLTGRTFLPAMEKQGKVTKDENGVYHLA